MSSIVDSLLTITTAVLVPVVAALFALMLVRLLDLGGFIREWWERAGDRRDWHSGSRSLVVDDPSSLLVDSVKGMSTLKNLVGTFIRRSVADDFHQLLVDKHAVDLEIESAGRLARLSFSIRVAPMLGLIGTLIPLGPALMNLSDGDISGMATQLVIAFGTTVLGLLVGGVAYGQWLVRRQWYASDLADIEFLQAVLATTRDDGA